MSQSKYPAKILVTGGAGFIGSAAIRYLVQNRGCEVLNYDKLTYAASLASLREVQNSANYHFVEADVCDYSGALRALTSFEPDAVLHAAAESHVDRSIAGPADFIETNLVGTYKFLEATREYWSGLAATRRERFRFIYVSTDEVYGSLGDEGLFTESTSYSPRSPYSASKAGGDHLTMAWYHTFGLPTLVTHCSNNYGPFQFPEKLVPLVILNALQGIQLPIYGTGNNVRDWLHVDDHVQALSTVLTAGEIGESYNIGGNNERTNLEIVSAICDILDRLRPKSTGSYRELISFVPDRPGHDKRYAIDSSKIKNELGWEAQHSFDEGLSSTVRWYLENEWWWKPYRS